MAKDIARQLRSFIRRSPKSVNAISQETGVSQSTLSRFVNGGEMTVGRAAKVAKALGLELKRIKRSKTTAAGSPEQKTAKAKRTRRRRRRRRIRTTESPILTPVAMVG